MICTYTEWVRICLQVYIFNIYVSVCVYVCARAFVCLGNFKVGWIFFFESTYLKHVTFYLQRFSGMGRCLSCAKFD